MSAGRRFLFYPERAKKESRGGERWACPWPPSPGLQSAGAYCEPCGGTPGSILTGERMNTSYFFRPVIGNSILFFLALVFGIQNFSYGKYILALAPAALALRVYLTLRRRAAPVPKSVVLLLCSLPCEYAFLLAFYLPDTLWRLTYLVATEFFRARLFMLAPLYSRDADWRCRLAEVYFIPAAINAFGWILFSRGPGAVFFPWLMPVFVSGWAALVFSIFQLTVYDIIRPKARQVEEASSRTRVERIAAWIAYCAGGYREPAREKAKPGKKPTRSAGTKEK